MNNAQSFEFKIHAIACAWNMSAPNLCRWTWLDAGHWTHFNKINNSLNATRDAKPQSLCVQLHGRVSECPATACVRLCVVSEMVLFVFISISANSRNT